MSKYRLIQKQNICGFQHLLIVLKESARYFIVKHFKILHVEPAKVF